jgi:hypothetical protein
MTSVSPSCQSTRDNWIQNPVATQDTRACALSDRKFPRLKSKYRRSYPRSCGCIQLFSPFCRGRMPRKVDAIEHLRQIKEQHKTIPQSQRNLKADSLRAGETTHAKMRRRIMGRTVSLDVPRSGGTRSASRSRADCQGMSCLMAGVHCHYARARGHQQEW